MPFSRTRSHSSLSQSSQSQSSQSQSSQSQSSGPLLPGPMRAAVCRAWLGMEALIEQHLGKALAAGPYRMFLLELYLAELENKSLFQSCFAADEAPANAHRRAARLADMGALIREPARDDHRRRDLSLAPAIRLAMNRIIHGTIGLQEALNDALRQPPGLSQDQAGTATNAHPSDATRLDEDETMSIHKSKVTAGGCITLPLDLRRALELQDGDAVLMTLQDDGLRIRSGRRALRLIQQRLQALAPRDGRVSEQLIAERRVENLHG